MRAQKRSSLSQRAAESAERHHDLLDDLGPDWQLGFQKNYPEVRCSLCALHSLLTRAFEG